MHVCLFKCFEQTYTSILPVKSYIMQIRCYFEATILNYKHVAELKNNNDTHERSTPSQLVLSRKWRRQTKTRGTYQLFKDWCLSTCFANKNQHNATRLFQEQLHIIGMVARIIHLVGGRSTKIAEQWNPRRMASTVTGDAPYGKLLRWPVLVNIQHKTPLHRTWVCHTWTLIELYWMFEMF